MPRSEFGPKDFEEGPWDRKREQELKEMLSPVAGICKTCMADLSVDEHEGWCPDA